MDESPADPTRIRFRSSFVARLEHLVGRLAALRGRADGGGRAALVGGGDEFVGHRPYRAGDELRDLDWNLLARFEEPFVRVHRRSAGERWTLLFDTSASMGLGQPSKLQRAAEVATGLALVGVAGGARVRLLAPGSGPGSGGVRSITLRSRADLRAWLEFLESLRAERADGLRGLLSSAAERGAERVFLVGDLFDLEPGEVAALARPGRALDVVRLLAPRELEPAVTAGGGRADDWVEWVDPETEEQLGVALDPLVRGRYERVLTAHLERWRETCARHRVAHGVWSSTQPFEDVVREVLFP